MAYSKEYRELIDAADEAIRALLAESIEESWIALRSGLGEIGQALRDEETRDRVHELRKEADELREQASQRRVADAEAHEHSRGIADEYRERKGEWRRTSMPAKESLVVEALGDDRLTVRELTQRMNERLGCETNSCLYRTAVESIVRRLLASGQLDRVRAPMGAREVWHYFRRRELEGPIADLERAWHDDEQAAA